MKKIESGAFEPKDIDLFQELQWAYAKRMVNRPLRESFIIEEGLQVAGVLVQGPGQKEGQRLQECAGKVAAKAVLMAVKKRVKEEDCVGLFLKSLPVFLNVDDEALDEIKKRLYKRSYGKGKAVFQRGDAVPTLYIVEAGRIEVFKTDDEYRRLTLWYIGPGELFCVPSLLSGTAIANAEVVKDAVLYCLEKEDFDELLERFPRIAAGFLKCLSSRIINYSRSVDTIVFTDASARIADVLIRYGENDGKGMTICPLSRNEIVSMTGACRETVSRILSRFRKEKIITLRGTSIVILDREELKKKTTARH